MSKTVKDFVWIRPLTVDDSCLYVYHCEIGRFTVLERTTGFTNGEGNEVRDTETGFRDKDDKFWLASGMMDIRQHPDLTEEQAMQWVMLHANTCIGE